MSHTLQISQTHIKEIHLTARKNKNAFNPLGQTHLSDGGDKGSRTPDLLNAIETLYQLSYIPNT